MAIGIQRSAEYRTSRKRRSCCRPHLALQMAAPMEDLLQVSAHLFPPDGADNNSVSSTIFPGVLEDTRCRQSLTIATTALQIRVSPADRLWAHTPSPTLPTSPTAY